ncbi:hypothetical protein C8R44DRAFT_751999 [Mycena epipterygia]|nr:hypothetical protein C8R44DRAFT_751999 [Mycena epipterygia]
MSFDPNSSPLQVSVILGELIGRYLNDGIMNFSIRRNKGVFEAESRLWACYVAMPLYICGFLVMGAAFQHHLSPGAIVMGWGFGGGGHYDQHRRRLLLLTGTHAQDAYCNDALPKHQFFRERLVINLCRVLGGHGVSFFQIPWAEEHGAFEVFGVEAVIVTGLFIPSHPSAAAERSCDTGTVLAALKENMFQRGSL